MALEIAREGHTGHIDPKSPDNVSQNFLSVKTGILAINSQTLIAYRARTPFVTAQGSYQIKALSLNNSFLAERPKPIPVIWMEQGFLFLSLLPRLEEFLVL